MKKILYKAFQVTVVLLIIMFYLIQGLIGAWNILKTVVVYHDMGVFIPNPFQTEVLVPYKLVNEGWMTYKTSTLDYHPEPEIGGYVVTGNTNLHGVFALNHTVYYNISSVPYNSYILTKHVSRSGPDHEPQWCAGDIERNYNYVESAFADWEISEIQICSRYEDSEQWDWIIQNHDNRYRNRKVYASYSNQEVIQQFRQLVMDYDKDKSNPEYYHGSKEGTRQACVLRVRFAGRGGLSWQKEVYRVGDKVYIHRCIPPLPDELAQFILQSVPEQEWGE
ncbi:MAG: hypothetical protein IKK58_04515 [Clostridia bacterium]|nr:hypothetical protein [Clostridia bacterium]